MAGKIDHRKILSETLAQDIEKVFIQVKELSVKQINELVAQSKSKLSELSKGTIDAESIKQQTELVSGLERIREEKRKLIAVEKEYERAKAAAARYDAQIANAPIGSYNRINAELNKNIFLLKNLSTQEKTYAQDKKKLTTEIQKQDAALKKLDAEMGRYQRNVGNYKSGINGLVTSLKSFAASFLSVYTAINLGKEIFTKTLKLDVLSQSFKYLIQDTEQLAQSQNFLKQVTKDYGLELITTSESYMRFRASIQGANFDLNKADKIFQSVAKAGAVLGLSSQRMELVFLALEQMISKGTISAEELRRQLGDNLPGAMQIMADALGVSIAELTKMIKANQVLATDALPKFAAQLEKTYGIESVKTIDNLQSAVNRLKNEWTGMIASLQATDAFKNAIANLENTAKIYRYLLDPDKYITEGAGAMSSKLFDDIINNTKKLNDTDKIRESLIRQVNVLKREELNIGGQILEIEDKKIKFGSDRLTLQNLETQNKALKDTRTQLMAILENDDKFKEMFSPDPAEVTTVIDETLDGLREQVRLATGYIEKLEAQKELNNYIIRQSSDTKEIRKLQRENELIAIKLKYYTEYIELTAIESKNADKIMEELTSKMFEEVSDPGLKRVFEAEQSTMMERLDRFTTLNEEFISAGNYFNQSFSNMLYEANAIELDAAQREVEIFQNKIDALKSSLSEEKRLKDEGKANDYDRMVDTIAQNQRLQDEANDKLEKAKKREAQIQLAAQASDIVTATADIIAGWTEVNPIAGVFLAMAQVAAMISAFASYKNKIKSMSAYAEGTEYVEGPGTETSDSVHARLSKGERVVNAKTNRLLGDFPNDKLPDAVNIWRLNFGNGGNYQRFDITSELLREYRKQTALNAKLLKNIEGKADILPAGETDNTVSILIVENNGRKIHKKTINK